MKTIILEKPEVFARSETAEPEKPGPGQVLVQVGRVGICGTDLHAFSGRQPFFEYPRILGHELGVEVLEVGEGVENVAAGMRCAVEPYMNCGTCRPCRIGRGNCCESLQVLGVHTDGGMRERIVVPAHKLHVSAKLALEQLALVETLGIGAHAVQRADIKEGEKVLVVGVGPIGLGAVQFAQLAGAEVAVLDASEQRLDFCRSQFGLEHCVRAGDGALAAVGDIFNGLPAAVFDATGHLGAMEASFELVASAGRLVYIGFQREHVSFPNPEFHRREMTIMSSRNALGGDFSRIISWMEEGRIDTQPWITHRLAYGDIVETFASLQNPNAGVLKAVLEL
ncbi:MAG: 2-desacetyl-2-hydroxyethyl bacteriochlorophyllide A dehydrogenase [Candidatus Latescibacterota bacterium]|jgi:2-desacetyl-2-hydroxyethyl bacteriochlorophyllide A dehydrogenase